MHAEVSEVEQLEEARRHVQHDDAAVVFAHTEYPRGYSGRAILLSNRLALNVQQLYDPARHGSLRCPNGRSDSAGFIVQIQAVSLMRNKSYTRR